MIETIGEVVAEPITKHEWHAETGVDRARRDREGVIELLPRWRRELPGPERRFPI